MFYKNKEYLIMKKIFLLFAALAIVFANVVVVKACPPGYAQSDWKTTTFNGCQIGYLFCYGEIGGYEGFSLQEIIVYPPCDQDVYENNKETLTDQILKEIAQSPEIGSLFPGNPDYIPECPDGTLCLLTVNNAFCYDGWEKKDYTKFEKPQPEDPDPYDYIWVMRICDDGNLRTCHSIIYFCWSTSDTEEPVLLMYKNGYQLGPPCPYPCKWNCEEE